MMVGMVLAGGFFVVWLFHRLRLPDVVGLVLYGVVVGPLGHLIVLRPNLKGLDTTMSLGAAFILFLGGRRISLTLLHQVRHTVALLATVGVGITVIVLALAVHFCLGTSWILSVGIAITMANTDPATIIPVLERVAVKPILRIAVETEAAFNDVFSALLLTVMVILNHHGANAMAFVATVGGLTVAGIGGLGIGKLVRYWEPRLAIRSTWLSAPMVVATPVLAFGVAQWIGGAGLLAAFIAGLASGSPEVGDSADTFEHVLSTGIRVVIFVATGALLPIFLMAGHWLMLLVVTVVLIGVARPITVWACVDASRQSPWKRNDRVFMMWIRETGAISIVLAMNLGRIYVGNARLILAAVAMSVLVTVALQAPTTGWVAKKLNVT